MTLSDVTGKRLFLLRHATALPQSTSDLNRALAPKGKEDAMVLGEYMLRHGYIPDLILCSSAMRTRQTMEGVQHSLGCGTMDLLDILYSGGAGDYLNEIQKVDDDFKNIMIIGHNPSIYELVRFLAAQGKDSIMQRLTEGYHPATLGVFQCGCDKWADIQPAENELFSLVDPMDYNAPARPTRWM